MAKKLAVVCIHGMGETKDDYYEDLEQGLKKRVGDAGWKSVEFLPLFYQQILQPNEDRVWAAMTKKHDLDFVKLRKFMLFGFGDAGSLEHHANGREGAYLECHRKIHQDLKSILHRMESPEVPVVLVAQSLGCQVISNYLWDGQSGERFFDGKPTSGVTDKKERFCRLSTLRRFVTTGCNIPLFVSGLSKIVPFSPPNASFEWLNYFDLDDVLGWPLKPLSPEYGKAVNKDVEMNSGSILTAWSPFSHTGYWSDKDVLQPTAELIGKLLKG